ncbi:hypothetical protein VSR68_29315 [Paraburkholderia phymatum]|uniref:hypothetical protein n=1 Tax=Paraburkholderia phymatum TaxID=148447 RepID=UPI00317A87B2
MTRVPSDSGNHSDNSAACRELIEAIEGARIAPGTAVNACLLAQVGALNLPDDRELAALVDRGLLENTGEGLAVARAGIASIVHFLASSREVRGSR